MGETRCLDCGREINGPLIRTPDGDTYHYACVGVEYPRECGTDWLLGILEEEDSELLGFFEFLDENPYARLSELKENAPEQRVMIHKKNRVSLFGKEIFNISTMGTSQNIVPILLQCISFGWAMERDYPAFADDDDMYPDGTARVPPEEEELSGSGD